MPKVKCTFENCRAVARPISGDCDFCHGHFCGSHRLLEDHKCQNLEDCKTAAFQQNLLLLNEQRTQVIKTV
jgi:predicted nucleic acid binding AN1-type Zn finger protein